MFSKQTLIRRLKDHYQRTIGIKIDQKMALKIINESTVKWCDQYYIKRDGESWICKTIKFIESSDDKTFIPYYLSSEKGKGRIYLMKASLTPSVISRDFVCSHSFKG
ncbi:hypothetical protein PM10SUCC1_02950 [Propionigenium maris DSM 9537]|uniref:Uncharacterized protein n=1 Tax=Propionigenium maris DSM 9537 TaxID=1123000 RepID=A0A9W6GIV7_9FUSO|nr:hypothetical protein [Propionigenium maris]GLI54780.1 hypothetical protein PM10SUCC1_02950 [Propionigenium maris DSM 9537]